MNISIEDLEYAPPSLFGEVPSFTATIRFLDATPMDFYNFDKACADGRIRTLHQLKEYLGIVSPSKYWRGEYCLPSIKNVYFNDPVTVVLWDDGTKTIVRCQEGDTYSKEVGLALCISKKALGNKGNFNDIFKKWIPEEKFDWGNLKEFIPEAKCCRNCKYLDRTYIVEPCTNCRHNTGNNNDPDNWIKQ